jgi:lipid-binding SYLF domain-containing protein
MKTHLIVARALAGWALMFTLAAPARADDTQDLVNQGKETLALFLKKDPSLQRFVDSSAGYVVYPKVYKGAAGVGGAHGKGALFERGAPVATAKLTQLTVGVQLGGQTYSEVIFFENQKVLNDFKTGEFALAAQVSAVALAAGAAKGAHYEKGVAVFTATGAGLMFEASVGGQKFSVKPLKE